MINAVVSITAIVGLTFLGWCLIEHAIDGTLMILVVGSIAGVAGYNVRSILNYLKGKNGGK